MKVIRKQSLLWLVPAVLVSACGQGKESVTYASRFDDLLDVSRRIKTEDDLEENQKRFDWLVQNADRNFLKSEATKGNTHHRQTAAIRILVEVLPPDEYVSLLPAILKTNSVDTASFAIFMPYVARHPLPIIELIRILKSERRWKVVYEILVNATHYTSEERKKLAPSFNQWMTRYFSKQTPLAKSALRRRAKIVGMLPPLDK